MKILIVADNNGIGHVKPFKGEDTLPGEPYWIAGKKFTVSEDSRIKLSRQFMEKHGVLRTDGRRAVIIDTCARYYLPHELTLTQREELKPVRINGMNVYLVRGAKILTGEDLFPYYKMNNGARLPVDVGE